MTPSPDDPSDASSVSEDKQQPVAEFQPIQLAAGDPVQMLRTLSRHYHVPEILIKSLFDLNARSRLPDGRLRSSDREFILSLEGEIVEFVVKPNVDSWKLSPLNSYYRLLTHKLAEYYNLGHILSNDGYSMVLFKINTSLVNADDETKKSAKFDHDGNIKPLDFRDLKFDPAEKLNRVKLAELYKAYKDQFHCEDTPPPATTSLLLPDSNMVQPYMAAPARYWGNGKQRTRSHSGISTSAASATTSVRMPQDSSEEGLADRQAGARRGGGHKGYHRNNRRNNGQGYVPQQYYNSQRYYSPYVGYQYVPHPEGTPAAAGATAGNVPGQSSGLPSIIPVVQNGTSRLVQPVSQPPQTQQKAPSPATPESSESSGSSQSLATKSSESSPDTKQTSSKSPSKITLPLGQLNPSQAVSFTPGASPRVLPYYYIPAMSYVKGKPGENATSGAKDAPQSKDNTTIVHPPFQYIYPPAYAQAARVDGLGVSGSQYYTPFYYNNAGGNPASGYYGQRYRGRGNNRGQRHQGYHNKRGGRSRGGRYYNSNSSRQANYNNNNNNTNEDASINGAVADTPAKQQTQDGTT